ncbi:hypothetical protein D3C87_175870 [compost metagenome]
MKSFLFAAALIFTLPAYSSSLFQESEVTLATLSILQTVETNQAGKVRGLQTLKAGDEAEVQLRYQGNDFVVRDSAFDCHFHSHDGALENAHCHQITDAESTVEIRRDLVFGTTELIESLNQSLDIFQRKIGAVASLVAVKLWQADDEIYVTLTHQASVNSVVNSHFMCHVHGSHFDCHRSRHAGPQEPQF